MKAQILTTIAAMLAMTTLQPVSAQTSGAMTAAESATDLTFVRKAAEGGNAEVAAATLARAKAGSPHVKAFARRMLVDHGAANARLKTLAKARGIALPQALAAADVKMNGTLKGLNGTTFDTTYLQGQRQAHMDTSTLFKAEISGGKDPGLVAFAKSVLPTVEQHIALDARDLAGLGAQSPGSKAMGR